MKLVVNWQAKVWNPPDAKSKWLGMDACQTWVVRLLGRRAARDPEIRRRRNRPDGRLVVALHCAALRRVEGRPAGNSRLAHSQPAVDGVAQGKGSNSHGSRSTSPSGNGRRRQDVCLFRQRRHGDAQERRLRVGHHMESPGSPPALRPQDGPGRGHRVLRGVDADRHRRRQHHVRHDGRRPGRREAHGPREAHERRGDHLPDLQPLHDP